MAFFGGPQPAGEGKAPLAEPGFFVFTLAALPLFFIFSDPNDIPALFPSVFMGWLYGDATDPGGLLMTPA